MKIAENTFISLGVIAPIIAGTFWLANVSAQGKENTNAISDLKIQNDKRDTVIQETHDAVLILCAKMRVKCNGH